MKSQEILICDIEHAGLHCQVKMADQMIGEQFFGTFLIVDGNFLNKPMRIDFSRYAAIDEFLRHLKSVIKVHDLAGGPDDVIDFLEKHDISIDPKVTGGYAIF